MSRYSGYRKFMGDRIARIAPLYLVTTLVCYGLIQAGWLHFGAPVHPNRALVPNLLAIQSWAWSPGSMNAPGWSVSTEWAANLIFPLLVTALLLHSRLTTWVIAALAFAALGLLAFVGAPWVDGSHAMGSLTIGPDATPAALLRCLASFILGLATYRLTRAPKVLERAGNNLSAAAVTVGILVLLPFRCAVLLLIALFCLLILSLHAQTSAIAWLLGRGPLHWLGVISFSIYLVHVPLLALDACLELLLVHSAHVRPEPLALKVVIALAVSALSYYGLENPARRALKRLFASRLPGVPYQVRLAQ